MEAEDAESHRGRQRGLCGGHYHRRHMTQNQVSVEGLGFSFGRVFDISAPYRLSVCHQNGARAYTGHTARATGAQCMAARGIELW